MYECGGMLRRRCIKRVYLLDFACYKPPPSLQTDIDKLMWCAKIYKTVILSPSGFHTFNPSPCLCPEKK